MAYAPRQIEPKWQAHWLEHETFRAEIDPARPKYYVLDMFPYPSGDGLHVGHPEGYTATDILARYKRMLGFNVLHPMGWDAFGLPAEQYAIKTGVHPKETTKSSIDNFRRQLQRFGFCYDWSREFGTIDDDYVKWTQWIFLKIYHSWFDADAQKARPIAELVAAFEAGERAATRIYLEPNKKRCAMRVMEVAVTMSGGAEKEAQKGGYIEYLPFPPGQEFTYRPCDEPLFLGDAASDKKKADTQLEELGEADPNGILGEKVPAGTWSASAAGAGVAVP